MPKTIEKHYKETAESQPVQYTEQPRLYRYRGYFETSSEQDIADLKAVVKPFESTEPTVTNLKEDLRKVVKPIDRSAEIEELVSSKPNKNNGWFNHTERNLPNHYHPTITNLFHALADGAGQRTNKFRVELNFPNSYFGKENFNQETLSILCNSVNFPQQDIGVVKIYRFGRPYNLRAERAFGDTVNISFYERTDGFVMNAFLDWLDYIDNSKIQGLGYHRINERSRVDRSLNIQLNNAVLPATRTKESFYNSDNFTMPNYQTDVIIHQLDVNGAVVQTCILQNAFITSIASKDFKDSEQDQIQIVNVTLTFSECIFSNPQEHYDYLSRSNIR